MIFKNRNRKRKDTRYLIENYTEVQEDECSARQSEAATLRSEALTELDAPIKQRGDMQVKSENLRSHISNSENLDFPHILQRDESQTVGGLSFEYSLFATTVWRNVVWKVTGRSFSR